ncbi:hypothetical protein FQA39_LY12714 [Lamprigera yunnana]|nr:hypothetical protein FQA39_LY12714 [Lamprigera yunnana]
MIDTGCGVCLVKLSIIEVLNLQICQTDTKPYGYGDDKNPAVKCLGVVTANLIVDDVKVTLEIYMVPDRLYYPFEFASVVKIFGRSKQYVIFKEEEWIQFHEQRENINKYFQTFDTMWKPRQIGSKTLTFEMIEEKKILKIEDMSGNKVYLGWESVSEVWSLESVLRYRLSYSSGSNFKYFYEDVIRAVAEMSGDVKINIYNIINRLSEKSDDVCCTLEVLLFMPEKALFDVQLERRIQEQGQKRVKKHLLKKMWMLYAQEHWTKSYDLKSAVERLYEELGALEFDADHEAIYGIERYYTVQQCEELRDKYKIGRKVCRKFLQGKTCSQCLVKRISEIGLRLFLDTVNKYIKDCSDSSLFIGRGGRMVHKKGPPPGSMVSCNEQQEDPDKRYGAKRYLQNIIFN